MHLVVMCIGPLIFFLFVWLSSYLHLYGLGYYMLCSSKIFKDVMKNQQTNDLCLEINKTLKAILNFK